METWRMTLTFPVLLAARLTVMEVMGANKAEAVRRIRDGDTDLPASRIAGDHVEWIIDAAAAGEAD
jgi:6-phosphogluconolactonase